MINGHPEVDPAIFDAEALGAVQKLLPPERLSAHLHDLDQNFAVLAECDSAHPALAGEAHKLVSHAGMLGLTRMAECARQVEDACRSGEGLAAALRHCREAIADVQLYALPAAGLAYSQARAA